MKPITNKTNKEIVKDINSIADIIGREELLKTLMLFEPDREYYHIKDFYVGICTYLNHLQNKKVESYLNSLKL